MIRKHTVFTNSNVSPIWPAIYAKASKLESGLSNFAREISLFKRDIPLESGKVMICALFKDVRGYCPDEELCKFFIRAAKTAHRTESVFIVEEHIDPQSVYVKSPLILRIKFFYKEERQPFFFWYMVFNDDFSPRIYKAGAAGLGMMGAEVMGKTVS